MPRLPRFQHPIFCLVFLLLSLCGLKARAQNPYFSQSARFIHYLKSAAFDSAHTMFSAEMAEAISAYRLGLTWNEMLRQGNGLQSTGDATLNYSGRHPVVSTVCVFNRSRLLLQLVFDSNAIAGLYFKEAPKPADYHKPAYAPDSLTYVEKNVSLQCGKYRLPGILTLPLASNRVPLVLMVHGSGPHDKDCSINNFKIFKDLALGLAAKGIASLRYDKRTLVYGKQSAESPDLLTVREESTDDALAAIQLVSTFPEIDSTRIFLLGHSLGALLAPRIAAESKLLKGIVMMAGNARPLQDVVLEQYAYIFSLDSLDADEKKELEQIKKLAESCKSNEWLKGKSSDELLLELPASYWADLNNYKQTETLKALTKPVLLLQGERDYQVSMTDYHIWTKTLGKKKNVQMKSYPLLNHLFIEGQGKSTATEYEKTGNVPAYIVEDISRWILKGRL